MKRIFVISILLVSANAFALSDQGYQTLHTFSRVLQQVETNYVEPVNDQQLIRGAIRGLLDTLDPHSVFMPPSTYKELKMETGGRFAGIGLEVTMKKGWITVVSPIDGSPADKADMKAGDQIVKINGKSTREMDLSEAVNLMRGKSGSKVVLTIMREDAKHPLDVALTRKVIQVPSIRSELLPDHIGYVRITSFQERTGEDLMTELKTMEKGGPLKGLVLDMRNNPGGLLDQAVLVSDLFLEKGVIVTTQSRKNEIDRRVATGAGTEPNYPIVVLVNGGSASASEIVAGALQDNNRAVVMGTQSFGKGSVQSVMELDDGSALKLTIARYFTPSGRSIQALGITPDLVVGDSPDDKTPKSGVYREANLPRHLSGNKKEAVPEVVSEKSNTATPAPEAPVKVAKGDYQKQQAVLLLQNWIKTHPGEILAPRKTKLSR